MRFHNAEFAKDYEHRLDAEGYPGILLDEIVGELDDAISVIDVGAGTGFFSIPLARMGYRITAIEPSEAMIRIFRKKMDQHIREVIEICHTDWDSWEGLKADKLICVHALYPMPDPAGALRKMKNSAGTSIVIVRSAAESESLSDIMRSRLGIRRSASPNDVSVKACLERLGISYHFRNIEQERVSAFSDLKAEARYWRAHLRVPDEQAGVVMEVLEKYTRKAGDEYTFQARYSDVMLMF